MLGLKIFYKCLLCISDSDRKLCPLVPRSVITMIVWLKYFELNSLDTLILDQSNVPHNVHIQNCIWRLIQFS